MTIFWLDVFLIFKVNIHLKMFEVGFQDNWKVIGKMLVRKRIVVLIPAAHPHFQEWQMRHLTLTNYLFLFSLTTNVCLVLADLEPIIPIHSPPMFMDSRKYIISTIHTADWTQPLVIDCIGIALCNMLIGCRWIQYSTSFWLVKFTFECFKVTRLGNGFASPLMLLWNASRQYYQY